MEEIRKVIQTTVKDVFNQDIEPELTRPDEQFGDYSTNVALQLAGKLGKNPREIAEEVASKLTTDIIQKVDVAGPGFLNLTLTDEALVRALETPKINKPYEGKTVVAEYSDPNALKPLHAGHLYTTLVGDIVARLFEQAGAKVIRLNYGGDVGLHVGKSMWAIIKYLEGENPERLDEVKEFERPNWLGERYVEGNNAYEEDENAKAEIIVVNKRVYGLHDNNDHDSEFAKIYWTVRQWSYDYFATLYEQLQVTPFDRFIPESEVAVLGMETVKEQLAKGVYEASEGAIVFKGENYGLHTRVFINSEGLPTYEAKDVGLLLRKWEDYHFDLSLVITANEQAQYYQVMLKSVEQFKPDPVKNSRHLTHGIVKLAGGVKMSSRKGNVISAIDILEAARQAGHATDIEHSEDSILAAIKYTFAKNRIGGDIVYDPVESIALEGNSGPYLQYAHARACGILSKKFEQQGEFLDLEPDERSLVRKISEYPEAVNKAVAELMPHHIAGYLYELAQTFNRFYEKNRVIDDPREATRLKIVQKYANTLKIGLEILGITAPEKM